MTKLKINPIYVSQEQAKLLKVHGYVNSSENKIPEQWQVIEWLWNEFKLWVYVIRDGGWFTPTITDSYDEDDQGAIEVKIKGRVDFDSAQEAYSAAFDYILKEYKL